MTTNTEPNIVDGILYLECASCGYADEPKYMLVVYGEIVCASCCIAHLDDQSYDEFMDKMREWVKDLNWL